MIIINGVETTTGDSIVSPDIDGGTIDSTTIGLNTPALARFKTDSIIKTATGNLSVAEVSGTIISNAGQVNDMALTMPAAAEGYSFLCDLATTVAKYVRFDVTGTETVMFDGVLTDAGDYIGIASAVAGAQIQFYTAPTGASTWEWRANTISNSWLAQ